jgi:hypothetical protein
VIQAGAIHGPGDRGRVFIGVIIWPHLSVTLRPEMTNRAKDRARSIDIDDHQ